MIHEIILSLWDIRWGGEVNSVRFTDLLDFVVGASYATDFWVEFREVGF